ncbi:MAG: mechanosensitive ion channel [Gemmatimonadales bacterium]|nr:mechanosensitive ion channel [Gemmatimonadales bacterium]
MRLRHLLFGSVIGCTLLVGATAAGWAQSTSVKVADSLTDRDSVGEMPADTNVPEPVGVLRAEQDEAIRGALQGVFDRVPGLAGVRVTVDAGVVRLTGSVVDGETRTKAGALAADMSGVVFVDNRIAESTSLEEQLAPTWARLRAMGYGTIAKLPLLLVALLIVGVAVWFGTLLARWSGPSFFRSRNPFLQGLIRRFIQGVVVVLGVIVALNLLDAAALVGAIVGTAGLAGLAIGFAFKDIVESYLAGTILAIRQPFAKNDHIRVDQFEGKVVRLTARETTLMSLDGNHIRLPNALIFRSPMINFTRNPLRRFDFDLGVGAADDLAHAQEVVIATLLAMSGVRDEPAPQAHVMGVGDSTVTVRVLAWTDQRDAEFNRVRSEAIRIVKRGLEDAGVTLPSPEYLVRMVSDPPPDSPEQKSTMPEKKVTQADVSVDDSVDQQIEVDRRASDEEDLLEGSPPNA